MITDYPKKLRRAVSIFIMIFLATGSIKACPLCNSSTAHEVRAELAAEGKGKALAAIITPFALLLAGLRIYSVGFINFYPISKE
ncbi:MAG: hypothetical protein V4727_01195 [Verrucomicrobiota bacterium]